MHFHRLLTILAFTFLSSSLYASPKLVNLSFHKSSVQVELAETYEERAKGLMYRKSLCTDCGMLFVFEKPRIAAFWMKNTFIPLDIAYLDSNGKIVMIAPLTPLSEKSVSSSTNVKYAWEMNRGWFKTHRVVVGDVIDIGIKH